MLALLTQHPTRHDAVLVIPVLVVIAIAVWLLMRFRRPHEAVISVLPVLLVVPLPYLWFVAVNQHSAVHTFFTYRIQAMAIFAILYAVLASIDWGPVITRAGNPLSGYRSGRSRGRVNASARESDGRNATRLDSGRPRGEQGRRDRLRTPRPPLEGAG
jgi:hypothetical protein